MAKNKKHKQKNKKTSLQKKMEDIKSDSNNKDEDDEKSDKEEESKQVKFKEDDDLKNTHKIDLLSFLKYFSIVVICFVCISALISFVKYVGDSSLKHKSYALTDALLKIEEVDSTVVDLNNAISGGIDKDSILDSSVEKSDVDSAIDTLTEVENDLNSALNSPELFENVSSITYLKESVSARLKMLDLGWQIYTQALTASKCIDEANNLGDYIVKADEKLKEADSYLAQNNKEKFIVAQDDSKSAKTYLELAKKSLEVLKSNNVDLNYQEYENYLNAKIDCCNHSINTIDAIFAEDPSQADYENKQYLASSSNAQSYVYDFNTVPANIIRTYYDLSIKDTIVAYKSARESAAANDAIINNYLNTL